MAQLHRFVKLNDRFDSQVFTFIVPSTITSDLSTDVYSRDFTYGYQRWCLCLVPYDKAVGAYLTLKNGSVGITVTVDFSFTMLNREHFTKNESIVEKEVQFTVDNPTHGRKTFIGLSDLDNRGFRHKHDMFLLELELRSIKTIFEQWLQLPRDPTRDHQARLPDERPRVETDYFSWGGFDWSLSVHPWGVGSWNPTENSHDPYHSHHPGGGPETGRPLVYLTRQTSFDHLCRTRYRITLGSGDRVMDSDVLERILDTSGSGPPYDVGYNLLSLSAGSKHRLRIRVELMSVSAISEVALCPFSRNRNRAHLYDRDKQAWMLEADAVNPTGRNTLTLRMWYSDIHNVPRRFSRYVCWSALLVSAAASRSSAAARHGATASVKPRSALDAPFSNYYSQTDTDEGYTMKTDIPIAELNGADSVWLDTEERRIVVQIEWIDSHLLFHASYHKHDDTHTCHKHQQWREIMALQAENYALEKQLHNYQVSIARQDNTPPTSGGREGSPAPPGPGGGAGVGGPGTGPGVTYSGRGAGGGVGVGMGGGMGGEGKYTHKTVANGRGPPNGSSDTGTRSDTFREMSRRWESGK